MKGSPEKILTFLKLSDCLFTMEHGQKINSYNFSRMKYPNNGSHRLMSHYKFPLRYRSIECMAVDGLHSAACIIVNIYTIELTSHSSIIPSTSQVRMPVDCIITNTMLHIQLRPTGTIWNFK